MNPAWAMPEYASMRTTFVWRRAIRLPTVIDATASTKNTGWITSGRTNSP